MKRNIFRFFLFAAIIVNSFAQSENELGNNKAIPQVQEILADYSREKLVAEIETEQDPMLRFLVGLEVILKVNAARAECRGSTYMNLGYTNPKGRNYESGISPESITDKADREGYKRLLELNASNGEITQRLLRIRNEILDLLRKELPKMDDKYRSRATAIIVSATV